MKKLFLAAAAVLMLAAPARAVEVDLTKQLVDDAGNPAPDQLAPKKGTDCGETKDYKCLTLGAAMQHSLLYSFQDEGTIDGEAKFKRGIMAQKLMGSERINLSAEDTALVKRLVGKLYGPFIVVQIWNTIDPQPK